MPLIRLLILGYGLSAIGAVACALAGTGILVAVLVAWLGGAVAVLSIGAVQVWLPALNAFLRGNLAEDTAPANAAPHHRRPVQSFH